MTVVRLLLAEENAALRDVLSRALRDSPELELVGVLSRTQGILGKAPALNPDVVLMDVHVKEGNALNLARQLRPLVPDVKIVLLTEEDASLYAEAAAANGISACLPKTASHSNLVRAVLSVVGEAETMQPRRLREKRKEKHA